MIRNECTLAHFYFRTDKPAALPQFLGSALRGVMGNQLLGRYCVSQNSECIGCKRKKECVIPIFFARQDQGNADNTLPNQYIIYHQGITKLTDEICFTLKLIGEAAEYAEIAAKALEDGCAQGISAKRIPFFMKSVTWGKVEVVNTDERDQAHTTQTPINHNITLTFDTPLQIRTHQEGIMWKLNFELLMRNILRRLEMLDICCIPKEQADELLALAAEVKIKDNHLHPFRMMRYSNHTKEKKSLSGLMGQITFSGKLSPFMPYLEAGSIVHIGKACTMGMGHYNIVETKK